MKKLQTVTDHWILSCAYNTIYQLRDKAEEHILTAVAEGRTSPIHQHWYNKYNEQLKELHAEILRIESKS